MSLVASAVDEQPAEIAAIASKNNPKICPFVLVLIKFIMMRFLLFSIYKIFHPLAMKLIY